MNKGGSPAAHTTPVAPTPYFCSHPYSSPENKTAPGFWKEKGGPSESNSPVKSIRGGDETVTWSSPQRLAPSVASLGDDLSFHSPVRNISPMSTQRSPAKTAHARNNSSGLSDAHLQIIAKNPNGRAHRDMGHITNDQRALVSSAHQTAISNFNLYAPGIGVMPEMSPSRRRSSSQGLTEYPEQDYHRGRRGSSGYDDEYYGGDYDMAYQNSLSSYSRPPSRSDQVSAPRTVQRHRDTLAEHTRAGVANLNSPHKLLTTPATTNTGHNTIVMNAPNMDFASPPPSQRRATVPQSRRRGASSSSKPSHTGPSYSGDEGPSQSHHRMASLIRYGDTSSLRAATPVDRPSSSFACGRSRPTSPAPSHHSCLTSATRRTSHSAGPWGGRHVPSSKPRPSSASLGPRPPKQTSGLFGGLLSFLAQIGLLTPPSHREGDGLHAPAPPRAPPSQRSAATTPRSTHTRASSTSRLSALLPSSRRSARSTASHTEREPDQDHVLSLLQEEEDGPERLRVLTLALQAMLDRMRRGESDPEERDESARAERLAIALDGNAHKGLQVLHAAVASPLARKHAHLAELATTVLTYMSSVRPLRAKILRHVFNGHSLLSDTVILMRAHVGTQAPIYVSCLHILNTLLTDPVLREGTLRAIPADLPENVRRYSSHQPPESQGGVECATFLRCALRRV